MNFGDNLQQQPSHQSLVHLQDAEIHLLESIKKCIEIRIKSDRQYANTLLGIVTQAQKLDSTIQNPVFQVWGSIVKETQNWINLLRDHADKLSLKGLERLSNIISEKKAAKKLYLEEKDRLDGELKKLKEDVTKLKLEYEKNVAKQIQDRLKLEELIAKGVPSKKIDDARTRLTKSALKLHKTHNEYVIALLEATEYEKHYLNTTLPGLLNYQEEILKLGISQCKSVLQEYADLTDFSTPEHLAIYKSIKEHVHSLSPSKEYQSFVQNKRTDKLTPSRLEFDERLLTGYNGILKENQLTVDNLTIDQIRLSNSKIAEQLQECHTTIVNKESSLSKKKELLAKASGKEHERNNFDPNWKAVLSLEREINELKCKEKVLKEIQEMYNQQLNRLGNKDPPMAVDLLEHSLLQEGPELHAADGAKGVQSKLNMVFSKLKKPGPVPPPPPEKDFMADSFEGKDGDAKPSETGLTNNSTPLPPTTVLRSAMGADSYQQVTVDVDKRVLAKMIPIPSQSLDNEEWFHGVLPREEVQRLLVNDGDFLVRASKNRKTGETQYVLSVMWQDHKHFIIQGEEGAWRFEAQEYPTIQELIINQHKSGVPVTRKSGAILKNPVLRENWELKNDDILLAQKIGNGNFGDVFKGTYKPTNLEVAIKTCRETLSEDAKKKFLQEGRILKQYEHPNIVKFIGIAAQRHPVMIVMEYVPGGSLLNFLKKQGPQQSKKQLVKMCQDAAAGMAYLESRNCIHRDLAARNCLVGKKNIVKISDFGMSREEEEYTVSGGLKQIPIKWTAPEALNYGTYTSACDVWSFGVLMWEVFSFGQSPYPGLTNTQAREKVDDGYRMPCPDGMPDSVYSLTLKCWQHEPKDRPHFVEINTELQKIHKSLC